MPLDANFAVVWGPVNAIAALTVCPATPHAQYLERFGAKGSPPMHPAAA